MAAAAGTAGRPGQSMTGPSWPPSPVATKRVGCWCCSMTSSRTSPPARVSSMAITALADAAGTGALLVTCRYPEARTGSWPRSRSRRCRRPRLAAVVPAPARPGQAEPADQRLLSFRIATPAAEPGRLLRGGRSSLRQAVSIRLAIWLPTTTSTSVEGSATAAAIDQAITGSANMLPLGNCLPCSPPDRRPSWPNRRGVAPRQVWSRGPRLHPRPDCAGFGPATASSANNPAEPALRVSGYRPHPPRTGPGHHRCTHPDSSHGHPHHSRRSRCLARAGSGHAATPIPGAAWAATPICSTSPVTWPPCAARTTSPTSAAHTVPMLPGTLAAAAYLAEVSPLIPADQRAWVTGAHLEAQALLNAGNLPAATRPQLDAIHRRIQDHASGQRHQQHMAAQSRPAVPPN